MPRTLTPALLATLTLALLVGGALTQREALARRAMPPAGPRQQLESARSTFEACALRAPDPEERLRRVELRVELDERLPARVRVHAGLEGRPVRAVERCVEREVRRLLRAGRGRGAQGGPTVFTFLPFAELDLPMEPVPPPATRALAPSESAQLLDRLRSAGSDGARLELLAALETQRLALPEEHAREALRTFEVESAHLAGQLCRVVTGPRALRVVRAALGGSHRRLFDQRVRGACGVQVAPAPQPPEPPITTPGQPGGPGEPTQPTPPPASECVQDSDCVLVCPAPPSCCPATCGCSHAVPRSQAAAEAAACEGVVNRQCPAMGCALQHFHPVCRSGRCGAARGMF